jgi:hypothetical protein
MVNGGHGASLRQPFGPTPSLGFVPPLVAVRAAAVPQEPGRSCRNRTPLPAAAKPPGLGQPRAAYPPSCRAPPGRAFALKNVGKSQPIQTSCSEISILNCLIRTGATSVNLSQHGTDPQMEHARLTSLTTALPSTQPSDSPIPLPGTGGSVATAAPSGASCAAAAASSLAGHTTATSAVKAASYCVAVGVNSAGVRWPTAPTATQQLAVLTHLPLAAARAVRAAVPRRAATPGPRHPSSRAPAPCRDRNRMERAGDWVAVGAVDQRTPALLTPTATQSPAYLAPSRRWRRRTSSLVLRSHADWAVLAAIDSAASACAEACRRRCDQPPPESAATTAAAGADAAAAAAAAAVAAPAVTGAPVGGGSAPTPAPPGASASPGASLCASPAPLCGAPPPPINAHTLICLRATRMSTSAPACSRAHRRRQSASAASVAKCRAHILLVRSPPPCLLCCPPCGGSGCCGSVRPACASASSRSLHSATCAELVDVTGCPGHGTHRAACPFRRRSSPEATSRRKWAAATVSMVGVTVVPGCAARGCAMAM